VNGTNVVEAYSLLEPAQCSVSGFEHRYERAVHVEIVQQKRERTVNVFRCHVVEKVFSQY
jgi:ABC-type Na+ transport system ATPase subunit NatA